MTVRPKIRPRESELLPDECLGWSEDRREELREFVREEASTESVDPAFKQRLRGELWELLRRELAPASADPERED